MSQSCRLNFNLHFFTVEPWISSSNFEYVGHTATLASQNDEEHVEFVFMSRPPIDADGTYSISMKRSSGANGILGFSANRSISSKHVGDYSFWNSIAFMKLNGTVTGGYGLGTSEVCMGRDIGADTMTLTYNPLEGTLHGAYNLEPAILLRIGIISGPIPLYPFFSSGIVGTSITIVNKPAAGLED